MPSPLSSSSPEARLDLILGQGSHPRRARPPDPHSDAGDATRVPLKAELDDRARRRESRLGLRNIFARHRGGSDADRDPISPRDGAQRPGGLRASLAEISWPYGLQHSPGFHRSETSLPPSRAPPTAQSLRHKKSESVVRQQPAHEGIAAWSPPPLFQAYPQAIKHAHLPACTVPAEVVLRMHHHKSSSSLAGLLSPGTPDLPEETAGEKARRRHRRNGSGSSSKFEWTSKVFVLVTSGYLLQYAGEGSYDRLPERVLQLGKGSAAFASDAIPGRHWVLQVSSVAESDRTPSSHSSSLRARLPFRGQERRHSSTFLMVFESAEQMEGWIVTLRREIEILGGRKVLSETGTPVSGGPGTQPRGPANPRALVTRDPDRFSRILTPDRSRSRNWAVASLDARHESAQVDLARKQSFDDTSTASFISHEGRQLDALRDSYNRLSLMSSGQRTMFTSVSSSPACSPTRDSFGEFEHAMADHLRREEPPQPRPRPNAKAIIDRRQSLQTINHVFELGVASDPSLRPLSTCSIPGQLDAAVSSGSGPQRAPSYTASHSSASKRQSLTRPAGLPPTQVTTSPLLSRMSVRRPPPSALSINPRPLSLVEDQPSPAMSALSRVGTGTESSGSPSPAVPNTPTSLSRHPLESNVRDRLLQDDSMRDSGISTQGDGPEVVLLVDRRPSSEPTDKDDLEEEQHGRWSPSGATFFDPHDEPRSRSSLGIYGGTQVTAEAASHSGSQARRLSSTPSRPLAAPSASSLLWREEPLQRGPLSPLLKPGPRSSQHLRPDAQPQPLMQRRSMSHLTEGPPPAPPPNRALPPIPQKAKVNVVPPPGFI